ncbi:MAG: sporulation transcriptional regulator SpoIIID [Oscillospiraceae bacterium]|nr:sporulation transcriptional regulator SpoIIID [Oscillospiraceae bacterium]
MREDIQERARLLALYIVENNATVRDAARHFSVSKSTVHKDLTERLRDIDHGLYAQARAVLEQNKAERHLRGGEATQRKYRGDKA